METTTKVCSKCETEKPASEFHRDRTKKGGFVYRCKSCTAIWAEANRDVLRATGRRHYQQNKEEYAALCREQRAKDRAAYNEKFRNRYAANKDKFASHVEKYTSRIMAENSAPPTAGGSKRCKGCLQDKAVSDFGLNKRLPGGRQVHCLECRREKARLQHLRDRYGISAAEFDRLNIEQGNACKMCGVAASDTKRGILVVDHCHATGMVRGLLCFRCNTALGQFGDDTSLMRRGIAYLEDARKTSDGNSSDFRSN